MGLVENQPAVVRRDVVGVLRPDVVGRGSARETVLGVAQRLAPCVAEIESEAVCHRTAQADLQGVVVGAPVAG